MPSMARSLPLTLTALFGLAAGAHAATISVAPTGNFPDDRDNVQSAISAAAPGDVVELAAGTFNWTGLDPNGDLGVFVGTPALILRGVGAPVIEGPDAYETPGGVIGFYLQPGADGLTIDGLTLRNLEIAIFAAADVDGLAVMNCNFDRAQWGVFARNNHDGHRYVGNTFTAPSLTEAPSGSIGLFLRDHHDFLITDNLLVGPGYDPALIGTLTARSIGIFLRDNVGGPGRSARGMVARNQAAGFDVCIASTATDGVVIENLTTGCRYGIGTGTVGGEVETTGVRAVLNVSEGNAEFGIWAAADRESIFLHNDLRDNADAGLVFQEGILAVPPIPSEENLSVHNTGSVRNMSGNRGGQPRGQGPPI